MMGMYIKKHPKRLEGSYGEENSPKRWGWWSRRQQNSKYNIERWATNRNELLPALHQTTQVSKRLSHELKVNKNGPRRKIMTLTSNLLFATALFSKFLALNFLLNSGCNRNGISLHRKVFLTFSTRQYTGWICLFLCNERIRKARSDKRIHTSGVTQFNVIKGHVAILMGGGYVTIKEL